MITVPIWLAWIVGIFFVYVVYDFTMMAKIRKDFKDRLPEGTKINEFNAHRLYQAAAELDREAVDGLRRIEKLKQLADVKENIVNLKSKRAEIAWNHATAYCSEMSKASTAIHEYLVKAVEVNDKHLDTVLDAIKAFEGVDIGESIKEDQLTAMLKIVSSAGSLKETTDRSSKETSELIRQAEASLDKINSVKNEAFEKNNYQLSLEKEHFEQIKRDLK